MDRLSRINFVRLCSQLCLGVALLTSLFRAWDASAQSAAAPRTDDREAKVIAAERALLEGLSRRDRSSPSDVDLSPQADLGADLQPLMLKSSSGDNSQGSRRIVVKKEVSTLRAGANIDSRDPQLQQDSGGKIFQQKALAQDVVNSDGGLDRSALRRKLEVSEQRVSDLERQLEEIKGQLTMAETELSRMATISEARNRASLGRALPASSGEKPSQEARKVPVSGELVTPSVEPLPASNDLMIVTVSVEKAELRLGPGKNNSALMSVGRGSRLAVEARQGEWYRVFAPNGQRAWILSSLVTVGDKSNVGQATTALRVRGYNSSLEEQAFRRVEAITGGR